MCFPRFDADLGLVPAIILCILIVSAISCYNSLFVVCSGEGACGGNVDFGFWKNIYLESQSYRNNKINLEPQTKGQARIC